MICGKTTPLCVYFTALRWKSQYKRLLGFEQKNGNIEKCGQKSYNAGGDIIGIDAGSTANALAEV